MIAAAWNESLWFTWGLWIASSFILVLQLVQNCIYIVHLFRSVPEFLKAKTRASRLREWWMLDSETTPPVSLLVPGYNEEATIVESVRLYVALLPDGSSASVLAMSWPRQGWPPLPGPRSERVRACA